MAVPTVDDVAAWIGIPVVPGDQRLIDCHRAALSWVLKRRSLTDPLDLWEEPDVCMGAVKYAALQYTSRAQPQGMPGFDDLGTFNSDLGMSMYDIKELVGLDPVIA